MPVSYSQAFLRELDKKLWTAAGRLRSELDAAVYKYVVLGPIFLKYILRAFTQRQAEIEATLRDSESDYFLCLNDCNSIGQLDEAIRQELEKRDYYFEKNFFWVPAPVRRKNLQASAKLLADTEIIVTSC